jgi:hypothetical protein
MKKFIWNRRDPLSFKSFAPTTPAVAQPPAGAYWQQALKNGPGRQYGSKH